MIAFKIHFSFWMVFIIILNNFFDPRYEHIKDRENEFGYCENRANDDI